MAKSLMEQLAKNPELEKQIMSAMKAKETSRNAAERARVRQVLLARKAQDAGLKVSDEEIEHYINHEKRTKN